MTNKNVKNDLRKTSRSIFHWENDLVNLEVCVFCRGKGFRWRRGKKLQECLFCEGNGFVENGQNNNKKKVHK